ncbi:PLDc N-terminal domain-containing protein [Paenarthrobacter sp. DKR-5]|uniref:PLD nuclease N-terminal domain-containing protein n=1 Tax=Paenarthrobacter sp. DKR-5 TaxID=2835535 RepID=UPI001BDD6D84|nr:PLD nuclease N-terminal domain-containing protein [Paenarthrobacter sp. DKR-5]MBT1001427.1 PLDc N-terminal domain-containing protein [Paenarthrobacter sp. DKR-5]
MRRKRIAQRRKSWKDLSGQQRRTVVLAGTLQLSLLVAALRDIARRPAEQIRGPKPAWAAACFVNFAGPIAYFLFGRRR